MKKVKINGRAFAAIAAVFLVFGMLGALVQYLGPTLRAGEEELKQKPGESINASVPAPSVSAEGAVLIDADSGRVLYEKNADKRLYPASTTKIMTALVALENSRTDDIVKIDPRAVGTEGSSAYLCAGEKVLLSDLLYAVMLGSANDAAAAIAYHIGGSIEGFAEMH